MQEIQASVEEERRNRQADWGTFTKGVTLRRVVTGCGLQAFQQLTGINCVMYYSPGIFKACGFGKQEQLLATGGVGIVNFLVGSRHQI